MVGRLRLGRRDCQRRGKAGRYTEMGFADVGVGHNTTDASLVARAEAGHECDVRALLPGSFPAIA